MQQFKTIYDLDIKNKVLFIRCDMNVPLENGQVSDASRIESSLETINYALVHGAKIIIATHLGRPKEGVVTDKDSVMPILNILEKQLNRDIPLINNFDQPISFDKHQVVMLENVRCNVGEKANDSVLGQKYAKLCDIFVHDAFATAHRAQSSTDSIGHFTNEVCAGILMTRELKALTEVTNNAKAPVVAIIGGAKVSTKLQVLTNLLDKVNLLIVGGGILNTFLLASGKPVGNSLVEQDLIEEAKHILQKARQLNVAIPLPTKVKVATEFSAKAKMTVKILEEINKDDMILDISDEFADELAQEIKQANVIIWNGPVGVFEFESFATGTKIVGQAIANCPGYTLAGGGDTIAAINRFKLANSLDYISSAGGAMIEFLEGKKLPAVKLLEDYARIG